MSGYDYQKGFVTEDYEPNRIAVGVIPESGIIFKILEVKELDGKNGKFKRAMCVANDGDKKARFEFVLDYSGSRLDALISKNYDTIINTPILMIGRGKKFSRQYSVIMVDETDKARFPNGSKQDVAVLKDLVEQTKANREE